LVVHQHAKRRRPRYPNHLSLLVLHLCKPAFVSEPGM
jgi:hypothetical protein